MPLSASIVGLAVEPRVFDLHARHAMAYAAGTGDHNPAYFDDTRPGGVIAPPMFGVRLDWPLRPFTPGMAGLAADEVRRGVHATHDMLFHRPARAGDRLTTTVRVVLAEQRRPGAYLVTRYDTVDAAGAPVLTTFYGSIFRGVPCEGERCLPDEMPTALPTPPREGRGDASENASGAEGYQQPMWTAAIPIAREMPHVYTECADIWNPIHTERSVALAAGLPDIILHGTATLALAARELLNREVGADPTRLTRLACRFGAMVIPGTTITVRATAEAHTESGRAVFFTVENAEGAPAIRDGVAVFR